MYIITAILIAFVCLSFWALFTLDEFTPRHFLDDKEDER